MVSARHGAAQRCGGYAAREMGVRGVPVERQNVCKAEAGSEFGAGALTRRGFVTRSCYPATGATLSEPSIPIGYLSRPLFAECSQFQK